VISVTAFYFEQTKKPPARASGQVQLNFEFLSII